MRERTPNTNSNQGGSRGNMKNAPALAANPAAAPPVPNAIPSSPARQLTGSQSYLLHTMKKILEKKFTDDYRLHLWLDTLSDAQYSRALDEAHFQSILDNNVFKIGLPEIAHLFYACLKLCVPSAQQVDANAVRPLEQGGSFARAFAGAFRGQALATSDHPKIQPFPPSNKKRSKSIHRSFGVRRQAQMRKKVRQLRSRRRTRLLLLPPEQPPCYINALPTEILSRIIKCAEEACVEEGVPVNALPPQSAGPSARGEYPVVYTCWQAQCWVLSLSLVCRSWRRIVTARVWSDLYIRDIESFKNVLTVLEASPHLCDLITDKALIFLGDLTASSRAIGLPPPPTDEIYPGPGEVRVAHDLLAQTEFHRVSKLATFLTLAKNLQTLYLYTCAAHFDGIYCMPSELHNALSNSSLRLLKLDFPILFADLECLLLRNKTLRSLVLDGGIDSGDGLDEISPEDHCLPLEELHVMSPLKIAGRIGKEQLCWLLRPTIGSLLKLTLQLPVFTRNVVLADGTSTVIDLPLAFASASFATVLSQLGSTLKVLILATAVPRPTMSLANLSEVPYDGSLDLALSHCQELETLFMPWQLTSTNFLEALASMERLKQLTLYTIPAPTCDCDRFAAMIEGGHWPRLKRIELINMAMTRTPPSWSARKFRRFLWACRKRGVNLDFDT